MAFLDELPLEILLAVLNWLTQEHMYKPEFCKLLPVASISTSLRQSLLPLLYRDLVFELRKIRNCSTRHNAALANSAGYSEFIGVDSFSCSDIIRQLDKELPKLRQVPPNACDTSSDITPVAYTPPSASFLTQLTSLWLSCNSQCIDINRLPPIFASTLVDLTLDGVNPENIWNAFYDGQEGQTVVFARLKRLVIQFENPLDWKRTGQLPPHLQGATRETVEFTTPIRYTDEERTGSVDLYKSAFTNLLRTKTNIQRMLFRSTVHNTLFQVPRDIGCANLRSLLLRVEVDFKSMLRLLRNLKHLVELELRTWYSSFEESKIVALTTTLPLQIRQDVQNIIRQLDKELPKLRQACPVTCDASSGIAPLTYTSPSTSFLAQLTSLRLDCNNRCIDANHLPQLFAPTLVDLTLDGVNPEDIWNAFYDSHESQTVVFARLKCLEILFVNPLHWGQISNLPSHLQGATNSALTKRSVWTAGAAGGKLGCRVPLFPVLRTLWCTNMAYDFHDFISRTQCHNSLVSLYVDNGDVPFDFDAELFKNLETVEFTSRIRSTDEERTDSVDLYRSAFTSLLRTKTNMQRMVFRSSARDTLFQVPQNIGWANLRSLLLRVEVDFKSMLRFLRNLKHLVELELSGKRESTYWFGASRGDTAEDIDELQLPQADYPPVSSTLRRFTCHLHAPKVRRCYTASYALELALHLPALESMALGVDQEGDVVFFEALLGKFLEQRSGSPYMNDGLLNVRFFPYWQDEIPHCWDHQQYWG
ncbi:hypothetical protein GQ54DRAFT_341811 [Martensiomyces pterosporus]|nr:hypothetical protein GQ54DRAFT_341811 [Martensiomyces pterosporus]